MAGFPAMFARSACRATPTIAWADGAGWVTFDVTSIQCPVTVLHGGSDRMGSMSSMHITPPQLSRPRNWSSSMISAISAS